MARFMEEGCSTIGCDPNPIVVEFGITKGLEIRFGSIECLSGKTSADILILSHVLEHIEDPIKFLQNAKDLLVDDGLIYIEVPGVDNPRVKGDNYSERWPRKSVQPNPIYKWIPCQLGRDALRQFIKVNAVRCHPVKS